MIYVTVGTHYLDFSRLLAAVDALAARGGEEFMVQKGLSETPLRHCTAFDFKPREEVLELQARARVIVCHAGIGSVLDALQAQRPFVVVPRLKRYKEHLTDHQLEIAHAVERRGWGRIITDMAELGEALAHPPPAPANYCPARDRLIEAVRRIVDTAAADKARR